MKLVKLTCNEKPEDYFFFRDDRDADIFEYVFKDHWCHITFSRSEEDVSMDRYIECSIIEDPKERAEKNLNWGFNVARSLGLDKETEEEKNFINSLIHKFAK